VSSAIRLNDKDSAAQVQPRRVRYENPVTVAVHKGTGPSSGATDQRMATKE